MYRLTWSASEKRLARDAFDDALELAHAKLVSEFKARAAAVATPADIWAIEDFLHQRRREIEEIFDYRYSVLPVVFAGLIRAGYLDEARLAGLSAEKREIIRSLLSP